MAKRNTLGKGLGAIFTDLVDEDGSSRPTYITCGIEELRPNAFQPRRSFSKEEISNLAESIKTNGVIQPIIVRKSGAEYEIITGERRWRAAQQAGLKQVPVVLREATDRDLAEWSLIENIQREDLNPLEEALALQRLADEFHMTHQDVAQAVGRSRAAVSNLLRLLELNEDVKERLRRGELEMGHARALAALRGGQQSELAARVVTRGLSVRDTEALVRRLLEGTRPARRDARVDPDIRRLQDDLSERLGARVSIQQGRQGKGKLVIQYSSLDELDGILEHFN